MRCSRPRAFARDERGTVTIIAALALPIAVGFVALVGEYGFGLSRQIENQRTADAAAYAAALASAGGGSTTAAANRIATLNRLAASNVTASAGPSPLNPSTQAITVAVATAKTILLAPIVGAGRTLSVTASAVAQAAQTVAPCIIALNASGSGVQLSGAASIQASSCAVASNAAVAVPCGASLTAKSLAYGSAVSQPCNGIKASPITAATTSDPLSPITAISTAQARAAGLSSIVSPAAPSIATGSDIDFGWNQTSTKAQAQAAGCAATFSGNTWTLACQGSGPFNFGALIVEGGINLAFNTAGVATAAYNFSGSVTHNGASATFGPGRYTIAGSLTLGGGATASFGSGAFSVGKGSSSCNGEGVFSICHTGSNLAFGAGSAFSLSAGLYVGGGALATLGSGSANSFWFGRASDGNSIYTAGGSNVSLGDATAASSLFQMAGSITAAGGGSCLSLGAAPQHDVNGSLNVAGGVTLGAGAWNFAGYAAFGANGGGDVTCNGSSVGLLAQGVAIVVAGASLPNGGSCNLQNFCLASGYGHVTLTAPTSGDLANIALIGPTAAQMRTNGVGAATATNSGALFTDGASQTTVSGALYMPAGPLAMAGGATIGNGAGQCLQIVAAQIVMSGGTAAGSTCITTASGGKTAVTLIQ